MIDVLQAAIDEVRAGRRAVLVTVIRATGSTPRGVGARMLVRADGTIAGTIGGGAFEALAIEDARDLLLDPETGARVRRSTFTEHGEDALGMVCGGAAEVLLEPLAPAERLVVFGAGHVGLALARLAASVGFEVHVVDDRQDACAAARATGVGQVWRCAADWHGDAPAVDGSYVAVVTRCHRTDLQALRAVLDRPLRYVGVIGSRRKKAVLWARLRAAGVDEAALERIRCPIGLPLGGDTPEEIAVSIVAELLQERHRLRTADSLRIATAR